MKELKITLGLSSIEHLKDKSMYNQNYYKLKSYGDWCFLNGNDILEDICNEDENFDTFALGHFEGDEFIRVLEWTGDYGESLEDYIKE